MTFVSLFLLGSPLLSPQVLDRLGLSGGNSSRSAGESGPPNFDYSNNRGGVSGDGGDVESGDVFFFMKSDSRIRETLGSILKSDRDPICRLWHQMLLKDMPETCLNKVRTNNLSTRRT